jgi:hypothetical protein
MKKITVALLEKDLHGLCKACQYFASCRRTCKPVSLLLAVDNSGFIERDHPYFPIRIIKGRERLVTSISGLATYEGEFAIQTKLMLEKAFSTENKPAFPG